MPWNLYLHPDGGTLMVSSGNIMASITLTSNTITLPINPNNVTDKSTALSVPLPMPLSLPMILSYGIESRTLTVQGVLFVGGQTASYIEQNYLIPLRNHVYRTMSLVADNQRYNGDYILQEFSYNEVQALVNYFTYSMTLQAYSTQVVI
jgi:hypothetical protein